MVFLGHDGPGHFAIAEGRVGLVPLPVYHGKPGKGLSIQMTVKHGPVTLLSVVQGARRASSCCSWRKANPCRARCCRSATPTAATASPSAPRSFMNAWSKAGPAHHCAIGVGHIAGKIEKLAALLGIECVRVC